MDLRTHYPFSLLRFGILRSYPSLNKDLKTDVAIIGAGITGALVARELAKKGMSCVVTDKRHVAMGSTSASTSLIQYEIDQPLHKLVDLVGYRQAVRSYEVSREAVAELGLICREQEMGEEYKKKCSFQFASYKKTRIGTGKGIYHSKKTRIFRGIPRRPNDPGTILFFSASGSLYLGGRPTGCLPAYA